MRVDLVQLGYEISLAQRNLVGYARGDSDIAARVAFHLHEERLQSFERPKRFANAFTPFNPWERLLNELVDASPDVVGLSCYVWNAQVSAQFTSHLKALSPRTLTILGGPQVTHTADAVLRRHPRIDAVVRGEGEETFRELVRRLLDGADPTEVAGTSWRLPDGSVRHNPPRPLLSRLDDIPPPYAAELAAEAPALRRYDDFVIYETLRGCPHDCGFCLYGAGSQRVRTYSVERVLADLVPILQAGLKAMVVDSSFGMGRRRALAILNGLAAAGPYRGEISVEAHPVLIDDRVADAFAAARTTQIGLGLQSVSGAANEAMHRPFDPDAFRTVLARLRERGLYHYVDVIFGMPGDTYAGFLETVDFALSLPATDVQFHRLLVLPGTRFHRDAAALGLRHADDPPYEVLATPTFSHGDLIRAHKLAFVYHLLHYAMGGVSATSRLLGAARHRPSEFLADLAAFLEGRGILLAVSPDAIGDIAYALRGVLGDFLREQGLAQAVSYSE